MAGYIGSKAVNLSTTGADINGNANVDGTLDVTGATTVTGAFTSLGIDDNAAATAVTIDASGNVGIGTATPGSPLDVTGTLGITVSQSKSDATTKSGRIRFQHYTNAEEPVTGLLCTSAAGSTSISYGGGSGAENAATEHRFYTAGTTTTTTGSERMRIKSDGVITLGPGPGAIGGVEVLPNYSAGSGLLYWNRTNTTAISTVLRFDNQGSAKGSITHDNATTSYNTTSDYRLKENITPVQGAADIVKAMQPVTYTFKSNGSWHDGFLAHELQELHPRAVIGEKDAMKDEEYEVTPAVEATYDDEGVELTPAVPAVMGTRSVPDHQQVDYSKLTPILTAALQEALNKIDALEARLTALEA